MDNTSLENKEIEKEEPLKILVVEDYKEIIELVKDIFEDKGHHITTFTSREEALDALRKQKEEKSSFDLVITNRGFAERLQGNMDGFEFIKTIREEKLGNPYVVMLTRSANIIKEDENWEQNLRSKGINVLMGKPFAKEQLLSLVDAVREPRTQSQNPQIA